MKHKHGLMAILSLSVAACAQSPDSIGASYVSDVQYRGLSCQSIQSELIRVNQRVAEVTGKQEAEVTEDAVATGVGLILFWPALFFLADGDHAAELGRLKGEYEALQRASAAQECGITHRQFEVTEPQGEAPARPNNTQLASRSEPGAAPFVAPASITTSWAGAGKRGSCGQAWKVVLRETDGQITGTAWWNDVKYDVRGKMEQGSRDINARGFKSQGYRRAIGPQFIGFEIGLQERDIEGILYADGTNNSCHTSVWLLNTQT